MRRHPALPFLWAAPIAALALAAGLIWLALRAAAPFALDVGAPGDGRFLGGFYDPEEGSGESFRWSGPDSRLLLHGATPGPGVLSLRLSGERLAELGAPTVELALGDGETLAFDVSAGWRSYQLLLPPGAAAGGSGLARPIELRTELSRPGDSEDDRDYRPLGVPLAEVGLRGLDGPHTPALPRALWLAWLLAVGASVVFVADAPFVRRPVPNYPWPQLTFLLLLGGLALAAWSWAAPYLLAWALPPSPWILGVASLLLGVAALHRARLPGFSPGFTAEGAEDVKLGSGAFVGGRLAGWPAALGGLALLVVANGLLNLQLAVGAGLALAVAGLALLAAGSRGLGAELWAPQGPDLGRRQALLLLGLVLLVALGMRLARLDELPFGLWRDEARHGLFAQRIRDSADYRPIYIASERVNMPALGLYPFAVALWLWGEQLWSMRLVTAAAGALTVLPLYGLVAWLSGRRAIGLLAALLLAASSWHTTVSRLAFPTVFDPLLTLTGLWLLAWGLRARSTIGAEGRPEGWDLRPLRLAACLLAGALIGLAVQTYHTGRVAPLVAGLLGLLLLLRGPRGWRAWLAGGLAAALGLAITVGPLVLYALTQPQAFNDRVGQVFLLGEPALRGRAPLDALDDAVRRHLLMFNVAGDPNGRHHAPGRPMLDYITGLGLLLGVGALLRRPGDWRTLFLAGGLAVSLLPSALAVDAPHGLRAFDAAAFACAIAAVGLWSLWRTLAARLPAANLPALARGAAAALLGLALALNAAVYYAIMPPDYEVFLGFYPVQSRMGAYIRELGDAGGPAATERLYVQRELRADPVFAFLTTGLPLRTFEGSDVSAPPPPGAVFLLSGYVYEEEAAELARYLGPAPTPESFGPSFPDGSRPTFVIYRVP